MSNARLVIVAVTVEKRPVSEVARSYGVARSWIYTLLARYATEGAAAFEPRSRRPKTSPAAIADATADLIVWLRKDLAGHPGAAQAAEVVVPAVRGGPAERVLAVRASPTTPSPPGPGPRC